MAAVPTNFDLLIVGCGSIGERHLQNLQELGVDSLVVVDVDEERRKHVASALDVPTESTLDDGLARDPDAVLVTVPNNHHVDVALDAARHGCHLFVEKPLSHTMADVDELLTVVADRDLVSMVGCNMRFHPCIRKIRDLVRQDVVGDVLSIRAQAGEYLPNWHPNRDYRTEYSAKRDQGGGVVLDYVHEINYVRWLMGHIETVSCFMGQLSPLEIETEDVAAILLGNENTIAEIHVDYLQREYARSCDVIGENGSIHWAWHDGRVRWENGDDSRVYEQPAEWSVNDMYKAEMRQFLSALAGGTEPVADLTDGARDLAVALGAKRSSRRGEHVSIDSDE